MTETYLQLVKVVMEQYRLDPINSLHGLQHWGRVNDIGQAIVAKNGGNSDVVRYFGLLHDSQRENEKHDPDHGRRAAKFARENRELIELSDTDFETLCNALELHADSETSDEPTIGSCWDADRLDLGRVGIVPRKNQLSTDVAKEDEFFQWGLRLNEKDAR